MLLGTLLFLAVLSAFVIKFGGDAVFMASNLLFIVVSTILFFL